jgi:hypothetical protein
MCLFSDVPHLQHNRVAESLALLEEVVCRVADVSTTSFPIGRFPMFAQVVEMSAEGFEGLVDISFDIRRRNRFRFEGSEATVVIVAISVGGSYQLIS